MGSPLQPTGTDKELERARTLARVLDTAIGIPGTKFRFGVDALLGLFPGVGDVLTGLMSTYIVLAAWRRGASASVIGRMLANIGIDTAVGSIPILGDVFDAAFKSNVRNVQLLERYVAAPKEVERRSVRMAALAVAVVAAIIVGLGFASVALAQFVWHLISSS
ncbi:MAG TPA: DUF4112 domain-containing protein [Gemmatimonadaceae bacterium]|nr:DUF4112 domain-containing protein [Gemmatimonadaceae bacterium]